MHCDRNTQFATRQAPWRGTIRKVPASEARRWPVYQRRAIATDRRRDWSYDQVELLVALLDAGHDYDTIAPRMKRTRTAIQIKVKRLRMTMTTRPTVLTAHEVGRLLGLRCSKRVPDWIDRGWLQGKPRITRGRTTRHIWGVQYDDLLGFLRDSRYWMTYDPALITDPELRAELVALRQDAPRWLTPGEVARRYHVDVGTVVQWIQKGFLPTTRYGNHWIWSAHLEGWVIPSMRSRAGIPRGAKRRVAGQAQIVQE